MTNERKLAIKDEYLKLIIDIGYDYDGFNTVESLKELIDELVGYADKALKNDDKTETYINGKGESLNILQEVIKK